MKLLSDTNVLLALAAECHSCHRSVRQWWESQPQDQRMHVCRPVQTGLLRLMSSEAALGEDALTLPDAWAAYATLLASGRFAFVLEPQGIDPLWEQFCRPFRKSPKDVMDAYLAAFAKAGGYRLVTLDHAFAKFPGLDHEVIGG